MRVIALAALTAIISALGAIALAAVRVCVPDGVAILLPDEVRSVNTAVLGVDVPIAPGDAKLTALLIAPSINKKLPRNIEVKYWTC